MKTKPSFIAFVRLLKPTLPAMLGIALSFAPLAAVAQQPGDFTYTTNNNGSGLGITIWGYTGPGGAVTIPSTINGLPVSQINGEGFDGDNLMTSLIIPGSVDFLSGDTFEGCVNLASIFFLGDAPATGMNVLVDTGATVYYLPGRAGWSVSYGGVPAEFSPAAWATVLAPHAASAVANVTNGLVVAATLPDEGWGYTNTPVVSIIGGDGVGAEGVAVVNGGVVTAINILASGSGYTSVPVVVVAPPFIPNPTIAISRLLALTWPTGTEALELDLGNLSPYDDYQLQFNPAPGGTWVNVGSPFTPTATTNTRYVDTVGNVGFFRVMHLP
jgi:hypothetical protein